MGGKSLGLYALRSRKFSNYVVKCGIVIDLTKL